MGMAEDKNENASREIPFLKKPILYENEDYDGWIGSAACSFVISTIKPARSHWSLSVEFTTTEYIREIKRVIAIRVCSSPSCRQISTVVFGPKRERRT